MCLCHKSSGHRLARRPHPRPVRRLAPSVPSPVPVVALRQAPQCSASPGPSWVSPDRADMIWEWVCTFAHVSYIYIYMPSLFYICLVMQNRGVCKSGYLKYSKIHNTLTFICHVRICYIHTSMLLYKLGTRPGSCCSDFNIHV